MNGKTLAASWLKKVGWTNSCKFPTEEITAARNFNSAPKFPQNGGFSAANFVFLEENSGTKIIYDRQEFMGGIAPCPPATG